MTAAKCGQVLWLPSGSARVEGHLELVPAEGGVRPVRIPTVHWSKFPPAGENLRAIASAASGVRLRLDTTGARLTLRVRCTHIRFGDAPGARNRFVAQIDGVTVATADAPVDHVLHVTVAGDEATTTAHRDSSLVEFDSLPVGKKTVTVFLPQGVIVDLLDVDGDAPVSAAAETGRPVWIHHGSSISHCVEPELPTSVWPVVSAAITGLDVINLGFGGQCMLDPFVADSIAATPADVISVKVGVNIVGARSMDQRTFVLQGFLDRVRRGHPDTPGPSDVEFLPDGGVRCHTSGDPADIAKGALTLASSRRHVEHVVMVRGKAGENITYLDGLALYGPADLQRHKLPDSLHPDANLYAEIGRRFAHFVFGEDGLVPRLTLG